MDKSIIAKIQSFGFDVYMRDENDTFLHFTDGQRIGYLQIDRLAGYSIGTVHKPNTRTGTGFGVWQGHEFGREELELGFIHSPHWCSDRSSVVKYRDIEEYRNANRFNADYKLVEKEAS